MTAGGFPVERGQHLSQIRCTIVAGAGHIAYGIRRHEAGDAGVVVSCPHDSIEALKECIRYCNEEGYEINRIVLLEEVARLITLGSWNWLRECATEIETLDQSHQLYPASSFFPPAVAASGEAAMAAP